MELDGHRRMREANNRSRIPTHLTLSDRTTSSCCRKARPSAGSPSLDRDFDLIHGQRRLARLFGREEATISTFAPCATRSRPSPIVLWLQ